MTTLQWGKWWQCVYSFTWKKREGCILAMGRDGIVVVVAVVAVIASLINCLP